MNAFPIIFLSVCASFTICYCLQFNFRLKYSGKEHSYLGSNATLESEIDCARLCLREQNCSSFQFHANARLCATHAVSFESDWTFDGRNREGNNVYYKENSNALGSSCREGDSCMKSECHFGNCVCNLGYSFNISDGTCVRRCHAYGMTMTSYQVGGLHGHNRLVFTASIDECVTRCVTETTFLCLSIDYNNARGKCLLATVGWLDVDADARDDTRGETWTFITRDCAP